MIERSEKFSSLQLAGMFSEKDVDIWMEVAFEFNPFVNILLIIESLFATCPSDNFLNQEKFVTKLIKLKINYEQEINQSNKPPPLNIGDFITIHEYIKHAKYSEFYCLNFLLVIKPERRRKFRFINIVDCYSITTETVLKRLFNAAYLGNATLLLPSNEMASLGELRKDFCNLSSEYGTKYKKRLILKFDGVVDEEYIPTTTIDNLLDASESHWFISDIHPSRPFFTGRLDMVVTCFSILETSGFNSNTNTNNLKFQYIKWSTVVNEYDMLLSELKAVTALNNRRLIFLHNPDDMLLWKNSSYFVSYFLIIRSNCLKTKYCSYLKRRMVMFSFDDFCQPVAPVDAENDFYGMIFSCIVAEVLSTIRFQKALTISRSNFISYSVSPNLEKNVWIQSLCFLRNIFNLLRTIGTVGENNVFCNSEGSLNGFDLIFSFPNCDQHPTFTNFTTIGHNNESQDGGGVLIINPFCFDLFFCVDKCPHELLRLPRYSFMQVDGSVGLALCRNHTCETLVYFKVFIVPEKIRWKVNRAMLQRANKIIPIIRDNVFNSFGFLSVNKHLAVIRQVIPLENSILSPHIIASPICSYKCCNYICHNSIKEHYFTYPYCDVCLQICAKLRRSYINDNEGYGLFTTSCLEKDCEILSEIITNEFYEILLECELISRFGSNAPINCDLIPYVLAIKMPNDNLLYLDQTTKRGVSSLMNYAASSLKTTDIMHDEEQPPSSGKKHNCRLLFGFDDNNITLKVISTQKIEAGDELRYANDSFFEQSSLNCTDSILCVDYKFI